MWWIETEMSFANEIKKRGQGRETEKKYQDEEMRKGQLCSRKDMKKQRLFLFGGSFLQNAFVVNSCIAWPFKQCLIQEFL